MRLPLNILRSDQPDFRPIKENGKIYRLESDYSAKWTYITRDHEGFEYVSTVRIKVPKGFLSDGLSASRFAAIFGMGRDGIHRAAVCIHDFLYDHKGHFKAGQNYHVYMGELGWVAGEGLFSRKEADKLFYAMLRHYGVKSWHRWGAYVAVRAFGWIWWPKK